MNRLLLLIFLLFPLSMVKGEESKGRVPQQVDPSFPGGVSARTDFLSKNIVYPQECLSAGVEGVVIVKYKVASDGSLSDFAIVESSGNKLLDTEALRVVSLFPAHKPCKIKGEPVSCYLTLPVSFVKK